MTEPGASVETLGALPFFEGFSPRFLRALVPLAREQSVRADDEVFREGDPARAFYLVLSGKVALEAVAPDRPRRTIQTVGTNEVIGWSWLLPPGRWTMDARAVKPTRLLAVEANGLRAALQEQPTEGFRFLMRLLPVIGQRLENTRVQLLDLHAI